jgi:signal transduction histidine kinase
VGAVVLGEGVRALEARAGVVALLTPAGDALEIVASPGTRRRVHGRGAPLARRRRDPHRRRHPRGARRVRGLDAEWRRRYPDGYVPPRAGDAAWAALPLGDAAVGAAGALLWTFDGARAFGRDERGLMETVARLCAQALERALLYEAEREAREEAQRQRVAAEDANRAKSDFLATMSHELRTPLNAIGGYTELLEMGLRGPVTDEQRADLVRIRRSQRHLLSLVTDVLDFVRLDAGRVHYETTDVNVAELVAHVTALVAPQMAEKSLAFVTECEEGAAVRADRDKVAQVLLNLLSNAIKFTPEGGRVTLSCARGARAGGAVTRFRVADTGIGIAAEYTRTIFEPFVQVQRGLTRNVHGAGLGLAISRDIAEAMRGDLGVESAPGAGSVFTLTLPAA